MRRGYLWLGGYSGLFKFNPATGAVRYYDAEHGGKGHLASSMIISLLEDSQRRLWIGSNAGLYLYRPATDDFYLYAGNHPDSMLTDKQIRIIREDGSGNIWVGTIDGGLNKLPRGVKGSTVIKARAQAPEGLSSNRIYDIAFDQNGELWLGTEKGLNILNPHNGRVKQITNNARDNYSLQEKSIRTLYIDQRGIYWLGNLSKWRQQIR